MASKLLNLVALSSLAILACSFGSTPVNALSVGTSDIHARSLGHHNLIAKKRRADSRRCKPRPSSSVVSASNAPAATPAPANNPAPAPPPNNPPAIPPPATGSGGGGKAGLSWPNGGYIPLKNFVSWKTSAIYSWDANKPAGSDELGLTFAPMLWGGDGDRIAKWKSTVKPGYAKIALGFNEPEMPGQANMSPEWAAQVWRDNIEPLTQQGYYLVSPAVTSAPSSKPWLQNFMTACAGCTVNAIAVHWYGTVAQEFIDYITDFHNTFGRPVWVTEYACQSFTNAPQCSDGQAADFLAQTTAFMDNAPWVEKYFYFGMMPNAPVSPVNWLMTPDNQLTSLGRKYLSI